MAYNEETGRLSFPAVITAQDMEDTFLPAFEAGVERGHAAGIILRVAVEGQEPADEAEGKDRASLLLPLKQDDLIAAVAMVAKAMVDKLPLITTRATGSLYWGARFYTGVPVFAFGEGLSYTSFAVPPLTVALSPGALDTARSEGTVVTRGRSAVVGHVEVRVTNTGARYGAHGVLLFVAPPAPIMARGAPRQSVLDFGKVALAPGTSQTLHFEVKPKDLTHADPRGTRVAPTGEWRFWVGTAADGAKVDANVTRVLLTSALRVEVQP